jgi:hypothetical protein
MLAVQPREDVLRLSGEGRSGTAIARKLGISAAHACEIIRNHAPVDPEKLRQRSLARQARERMTETPSSQRPASKSSDRPYSLRITGPDGFAFNCEHLSGEQLSRIWQKLVGAP